MSIFQPFRDSAGFPSSVAVEPFASARRISISFLRRAKILIPFDAAGRFSVHSLLSHSTFLFLRPRHRAPFFPRSSRTLEKDPTSRFSMTISTRSWKDAKNRRFPITSARAPRRHRRRLGRRRDGEEIYRVILKWHIPVLLERVRHLRDSYVFSRRRINAGIMGRRSLISTAEIFVSIYRRVRITFHLP